jgi:hypothetical protein
MQAFIRIFKDMEILHLDCQYFFNFDKIIFDQFVVDKVK